MPFLRLYRGGCTDFRFGNKVAVGRIFMKYLRTGRPIGAMVLILMCIFFSNHALAQVTNFNVSASSDQNYTINTQSDPALGMQRGRTYFFSVAAFGHPFYIKTTPSTGTGNAYNNGVSGNGTEFGTLTFTVPMDAPNTLFYHCSEHLNMGNSITITNAPTPPNDPPTVTITNPPNDSIFTAPAVITIEVSAGDVGGSVTNVQFLVNGGVIADDSQPPFSATTSPLSQGAYILSAIASDNLGARATNTINITVNAPENAPPAVSINDPPNDAKFLAPATISLTALATDSDGSVTNVRLYSAAMLLTNLTAEPYGIGLTNLAAGNYSFVAAADDNSGASTTSSVVNIFVLTNAILSLPVFSSNQFQFTVTGIEGQTYISEISSDLMTWTSFATNLAPANVFDVVCSTSTNISGFRVRQDF
jgi:hypothetical protein